MRERKGLTDCRLEYVTKKNHCKLRKMGLSDPQVCIAGSLSLPPTLKVYEMQS